MSIPGVLLQIFCTFLISLHFNGIKFVKDPQLNILLIASHPLTLFISNFTNHPFIKSETLLTAKSPLLIFESKQRFSRKAGKLFVYQNCLKFPSIASMDINCKGSSFEILSKEILVSCEPKPLYEFLRLNLPSTNR